MLYGGSFDPAYVLTVSSNQYHLKSALNNKNAASLQIRMQEVVGVLPERGLVKFEVLAESNIATKGKTLSCEIADLQKKMKADYSNFNSYLASTSRAKPRPGSKSMRNPKTTKTLPTHHEGMFTAPESDDGAPPPPPILRGRNDESQKSDKVQKLSRRKSFSTWIFSSHGSRQS